MDPWLGEALLVGSSSHCATLSSILIRFQTENLIKALEDLENSASSDAAVRERIAALPPEVSDASLLGKLAGEFGGDKRCKVGVKCLVHKGNPGTVSEGSPLKQDTCLD